MLQPDPSRSWLFARGAQKDPGGPSPGPPSQWPLLAAGGAGVALPLALAALGAARPGPALIAAALMAVLSVALWLLRPRRSSADLPPAIAALSNRAAIGDTPFALILEGLADPVLLVAGGRRADLGARRFVFANAAARDLLRIGRPEGPLTTAIRAPEVLAAVERALYDATSADAIYEPGGVQDRVWRARAAPFAGGESAALDGCLALLTLRDETESRRSERTRADFLANASHELRTPLASLAGFIETLRGHAREDPDARDRFLAIMHSQAQRMRRLIEDLMSLSRIELAEHIRPSGTVDVGIAAIDVLDALGPLAKERCVRFDSTLPGRDEALALADRDQILQVIQNLVENALKYTPGGGAVSVEVEAGLDNIAAFGKSASEVIAQLSLLTPDHAAGQRYVTLRVRDTGPGIARTHLPRLTERFYRVEGQKSGEHAGTGLGLAIVKHIVNRHRGGLTVQSIEGRGSTFTVYLPQAGKSASDLDERDAG